MLPVIIGTLIFIGVMTNDDYRPAIVALLVVFVLELIGFALFGRHRLVLSPEEEYAMTGGLHGASAETGEPARTPTA